MSRCNDSNRKQLMNFVLNAPFEESVIKMDCNDGCESISRMAERVAAGEKIEDLLPEFEQHIQYWKDCREEFEALVAVLKAERAGQLAALSNHEQPRTEPEQQNPPNE